MESKLQPQTNPDEKAPSTLMRVAHLFLPFVAIACGILLTMWLVNTKPKAHQRPKLKNATVVRVQEVQPRTETISLEAMGTIVPAQSITLASEVTGKITALSPSFYPGGVFAKDTPMAYIDKRNYTLSLRQKKATLLSARAALSIEGGNQMVAKKEFELLGETVSDAEKSLMLRAPQLDQLRADLENAQASYNQAELDLNRTTITAPFNGMVQDLTTDVGSLVGSGTSLGSFVGTDAFWLELLIPVADLQWIDIPQNKNDKGSAVRLFNQAGWGENFREAHIIGLMAGLETNGRLAKILVRIDDPLALLPKNSGKPRVLLDSYVHAEIMGKPIKNAIAIDRNHIHDGDTLWVITPEETLEIREVSPIFKDKKRVILHSGISTGESYITSSIAAPVDGMLLQKEDKQQKKNKAQKASKVQGAAQPPKVSQSKE